MNRTRFSRETRKQKNGKRNNNTTFVKKTGLLKDTNVWIRNVHFTWEKLIKWHLICHLVNAMRFFFFFFFFCLFFFCSFSFFLFSFFVGKTEMLSLPDVPLSCSLYPPTLLDGLQPDFHSYRKCLFCSNEKH